MKWLICLFCLTSLAQDHILDWRDRSPVFNNMLKDRLENLLLPMMREAKIDMWLVINREYNEDPVYFSLVPQPTFAARRTTILVFHDKGQEGLGRFTISRYPLGDFYKAAWEGGDLEAQWKRVGEIIRERNPKRIGINVSKHWPVADGLSSGLHQRLKDAIGPDLTTKLVSAERLAIRWLETRSQAQLEVYPQIVRLARNVIAEAFSNKVITPGVTTTDDVANYIRERFSELELPIWFHPYVNRQSVDQNPSLDNPFFGTSGVIHRGDVLHTDVGITYLGLNTDTQEMGYVLKLGEENIPEGLAKALQIGNRWQDILTSQFKTGRTGNEILRLTRKQSEKEGILGSVYTHPLGAFGHAPGPTIGMWDNQGDTPIRGDWPLYANTCYAIEGNVKVQVPEWDNKYVQIKLEQDAVFDGHQVIYLGDRQTQWHIIH